MHAVAVGHAPVRPPALHRAPLRPGPPLPPQISLSGPATDPTKISPSGSITLESGVLNLVATQVSGFVFGCALLDGDQ